MNTGFIGVGSMGGMLVRAFLRSGALAPKNVWAANRSQPKLDALASAFPGIRMVSNKQVAANCDLTFICAGAAETVTVLNEIDSALHSEKSVITTAAVIPLKKLEDRVPCRVAKVIPSITQEVSAGIALVMYGSRNTAEDRSILESLLGRISQPVVIEESQARPAIGLASGGPALLAYVLQTIAEEAASSNSEVSTELARKLVTESAAAAMRLIQEASMTTEEIMRRVAAPGGMTALGIEILSRYVPQGWRTVFRETVERESELRESLAL